MLFLPPAFDIVPRLLLLLKDPETNSETLADLIHVDAGLTTDVLQVCNSATFAGNTRAETLFQAVMRLGLREIYRTVIKVVGASLFSHAGEVGIARLNLWQHSLAVALGAQVVARELHEDPDLAFTAGLLHDIGKLILNEAAGQEYFHIIDQCMQGSTAFWTEERLRFGTDHAAAGGRLLRRWSFPEPIVASVLFHHDPLLAPKTHTRLTAAAHVGNLLAHRVGYGYGNPDYPADLQPDLLHALDLTEQTLSSLEPDIETLLEAERSRIR